jgi:hypothetical protein
MFGWNERQLVNAALTALGQDIASDDGKKTASQLLNLLQRLYYELRNLGQAPQDRALNYSATNAFQAGSVMVEQVLKVQQDKDTYNGVFELDSISVERSPFCRIDSDCWDVYLKFFYPNNVLLARDLYSYTVDVSDTFPVFIGPTRKWSVPT